MKNTFKLEQRINLIKVLRSVTVFLAAIVIFSACGNGERAARQAQKGQLEEAKEQTKTSVEMVKDDINERIEYIKEQKEDATGEVEEELKVAQSELEEQMKQLDARLAKVEEATVETWQDVLAETSGMVEESKKKTNEVSAKVLKMFDDEDEEELE